MIGDEGCAAIAEALKTNSSVTKLGLRGEYDVMVCVMVVCVCVMVYVGVCDG